MEKEFLGMNFTCVMVSLAEQDLPEKDCFLPLIAKILGYCIVAASITVKLPQVVGFTAALACLHKGLPFYAYGELVFLLLQAIVLVAIIYYYSQPLGAKIWIKASLYCAVAPSILAGQIHPVLFEVLYNKSTGELSFLTNFRNFGGSAVRSSQAFRRKLQQAYQNFLFKMLKE